MEADEMSCGNEQGRCNEGECRNGESAAAKNVNAGNGNIEMRMSRIRRKIMVLSGKGGVGKSTVAANLAIALALEGNRVGLLDVDFHGPSIPTLLNLEGRQLSYDGNSISPVRFSDNLNVVSLGFLLRNRDDAVIWRGPMKINVIRQILSETEWGDLDFLIVDFPPGTGDEPLSVAQLMPGIDGAVIVTTPQNLSVIDVRKSINFCRQVHVPVLGVIENMSGFFCPHCGKEAHLFKPGGGEAMARDMGVPFLGRIPVDPMIAEASDNGRPFVHFHGNMETAKAFSRIVERIGTREKAV
jgi:Mrp family chromosome partitioning ATPase